RSGVICTFCSEAKSKGEFARGQGRTGGGNWAGSYCQAGPLNTRRAAHSMHHTYRPVSGILGKNTHTLNIILDDYKEITSYVFFFITFGSTNLPGWTHGIK